LNEEIDLLNFKVICQKCGKTGMVDLTKYIDEEFIKREGGVERYVPTFIYYICKKCFNKT